MRPGRDKVGCVSLLTGDHLLAAARAPALAAWPDRLRPHVGRLATPDILTPFNLIEINSFGKLEVENLS
jgi:hypothetical protein